MAERVASLPQERQRGVAHETMCPTAHWTWLSVGRVLIKRSHTAFVLPFSGGSARPVFPSLTSVAGAFFRLPIRRSSEWDDAADMQSNHNNNNNNKATRQEWSSNAPARCSGFDAQSLMMRWFVGFDPDWTPKRAANRVRVFTPLPSIARSTEG